jgi:hypothetical protein
VLSGPACPAAHPQTVRLTGWPEGRGIVVAPPLDVSGDVRVNVVGLSYNSDALDAAFGSDLGYCGTKESFARLLAGRNPWGGRNVRVEVAGSEVGWFDDADDRKYWESIDYACKSGVDVTCRCVASAGGSGEILKLRVWLLSRNAMMKLVTGK